MSRPLSIMPYFGGKSRMSKFICDRLNYNTSTFITLFGGACRILLNKPPHKIEIYNDFGSGVCALMEMLSKPDTAQELIDRLYCETEYSREQFEWAKEIYYLCETDMECQCRGELKQLLIQNHIVPRVTAEKFVNYLRKRYLREDQNEISPQFKKYLKCLFAKRHDIAFKDKFKRSFDNWIKVYDAKENDTLLPPREMMAGEKISDMELAMATYIYFTFSFSGMGQHFKENRFRDNDEYREHILNLYRCAERLNGVQVMQIDAMMLCLNNHIKDKMLEPFVKRTILYQWLRNPDIMMFCDPSYIDPKHEASLLHDPKHGIDINVDRVDSVSDAIDRAWHGKKQPKNLGAIYSRSFGYHEQEEFLRGIQDAKCKILVCNYDLELYDKYLNEKTGWTKEVYPTKTNAANHLGNDNNRLECIWYNY